MMQNHSLTSLYSVSAEDLVLHVSRSPGGTQIAVGTSSSCLVLDARTGRKVFATDRCRKAVTAVAFTTEEQLLVGGQGVLRLWDIWEGNALAALELSEGGEKPGGAMEAVQLAKQPRGDLFAVASEHGRKIFIVDHNLAVQYELEMRSTCGRLSELSWLSDSILLANSSGGIQGWICGHGSSQPSLILGRSIGLLSARASPDQSTLAAGSRDGVVYLWSLVEGGQQQGDEPIGAELRSTLKDYVDEVHLLRWDPAGRYLASMDGPDATIWDVPQLFQQTVRSTICCGHEPNSRILCASFQDDGPMLEAVIALSQIPSDRILSIQTKHQLEVYKVDVWGLQATGGSDGKVLCYNSALFQPGQVSQPCAAAQFIPPGDGVTSLTWLQEGQLVAGMQSGKIIGWQLQPIAFDDAAPAPPKEDALLETEPSADSSKPQKESSVPPGGSSAGGSGVNGFASKRSITRIAQRQGRGDVLGPVPISGRFGRGGRGGRGDTIEVAPGAPLADRQSSVPNARSARELAEKLRGSVHPAMDAPADGLDSSSRSTSLQDGSSQSLGRRATSLERQQLSPSLMQHIQRVQQKPAATSRQREPAGWGMGAPAAPPPTSTQMPYGQAGGAVPFNAGHPQMQGGMQPGFMMMPNAHQAQQMSAGGMMSYGFSPAMAHMPMMNPSAAQQQGMLGHTSLPNVPAGMVYMPVGAPPVPQQQWQMLQSPWMGPYFLHPGQRVPEPINIMAAGRSASAPEGPVGFNWAANPVPTSGSYHANGGGDALGKSALSLPSTVDGEWRNQAALRAAEKANGQASSPPETDAMAPSTAPGAMKRRSSTTSMEATVPAASPPPSAASREAKEGSEGLQRAETSGSRLWSSPSGTMKPQASQGSLPEPSAGASGEDGVEAVDPANPIVTVYIGNLPPTIDEVALMVPFSYFGGITNVQVIRDKNSLQSRGFAFVSYSQPVSAAAAIQNMNGRILYGSFRGRALKVGPSNRVI